MDDTQEPPLPRAVALAWGLDEPGTRGPKRGLTLDQVLDAAIAVGDAEGFAALSMGRVARELGFTTMSLYRYVDSKDTLIELVMDRLVGRPPEIPASASWRAALELWAWGEYRAIDAHPWWLDVPISTPPLGPNNLAWLEAGLGAFRHTRLPGPVKFQLVMNLTLFVMGRMRLLRELSAREADRYGPVLARLIDPERFPELTAAVAEDTFVDDRDPDWPEADFRFGLDRLLDGYEPFLAAYE